MKSGAAVFLLSIFVAGAAGAAQPTPEGDVTARALRLNEMKSQAAGSAHAFGVHALDACTPKTLSAPANLSGNISTLSCYDAVINSYEDIYNVFGVAGQTITIDYSSNAYSVFLYMEGVHVDIISFLSTSGVSKERIVYTFPTSRTYKLEAESLYGPGDGQPYTGPYALTASTTGGAACTNTTTTMCLSGGRFAVSASWATSTSSGQGTAVGITSDTGYFTFFSATNVEVVVKVLNACSLNSKYWVFAGGLTNVNVVLTVRDTQTGTVKTYTNPLNAPFQPIQDTSALATCP